MIIVTGGAGFIGSAFIRKLNDERIFDIVVVDELRSAEKWKNLRGKRFADFFHKTDFLKLVEEKKAPRASVVVHLGACSSTTEKDADYLMRNNFKYSQSIARWANEQQARFIYASSAATYGDGAQGYSDGTKMERLQPLNAYGFSKQIFDLWMKNQGLSDAGVGVKFFNVFGPNEYHKTDMRSMVHKAWGQVKSEGRVRLFKSYKPEYADGGQLRDFVYIKDCCEILWWLMNNRAVSGVLNLGTGVARSWNDLATAVFAALGKTPSIEYIDMPETLQRQYQYFTQADMQKLKLSGCHYSFRSLEENVADYVQNHLEQENQYW